MYKILVPTDFSEFSDYAIQYGAFLSKNNKDGLHILHVLKNKSKFDEVKKQLKNISKNNTVRGLNIQTIIEKGHNVSKNINKVAEQLDVNLIIMGSNGVSNVEEMILGSNTENVITKTRFDVLTVKHELHSEDLNAILFPSDFSPEAYTVFDSVIGIAAAFNAKIHLLKIGRNNKANQSKIQSFVEYFNLRDTSIKFTTAIKKHAIKELGILDYAIENDIDLIAMGTHGKGAIKRFLQESTSQNVVRDAFRPVLTMRF